jgi:hypothetical protein
VKLYLKKSITKIGLGGVAQGVGSEFKPQYHTHKKSDNDNGTSADDHEDNNSSLDLLSTFHVPGTVPSTYLD